MAASLEELSAGRPRELWVDVLRVVVVAGVIVVHTATAYISDVADWYYDELTTSTFWSTLLVFPAVAGAMFGLGPLFFLAGWFSPRALAHRGPGGYASSRLVRLGVPLVVFLVLIQPLADVVGSSHDEVRLSYRSALGDTELSVMWFVFAILVFSMVYAAARRIFPRPSTRTPARLGLLLAAAAVVIAACSLLVWQLWAWNSGALRTARLGEWPQGAVLFALGVHAGERGWLDRLPRSLARRLGWVALAGTLAIVALFAALDVSGESEAVLDEGAGWGTVPFAVLDGVVAVSLTVWLLDWARRHWRTHGRLVGQAARASYPAYVMHPLLLTTVMVLLAPVPAAPEVKFLLVSLVGVPVCFAGGWVLTRIPGVSKVV